MKQRDYITKLYSWFAVILLLSFISSIWVVWDRITPVIVWWVFLLAQLIGEIILLLVSKVSTKRNFVLESSGYKYAFPKNVIIKKHVLYVISFVLLWLGGIFLLSRYTSTDVLNSPWQVINKYYIVIFFFLTVLLFLICLSKHKIKLVVLFLILYSVLLHFYLPASSHFPWGGDVWRHIAVENKLMQGDVEMPVLVGPEAKWKQVVNIDLPEALVIPNKYFYGQLWGSTVLLSIVSGFDLLFINIWLIPILWGIMIPVIMFRIGRLLFGSWRSGLLLSLFVSAFFPFQALGGLTLPVSLGYLTFFFVLMLWLQYLQDGNMAQRNLVFFFSFLMVFGYSLHFVLIWLVIGISLFMQYLSRKNLPEKNIFQNNYLRIPLISVGTAFLVLFFPLLEYLMHSSYFGKGLDILSKLIQMFGQFSGWYFATAIRPHDILSGNIIFNHTPSYAFVSSIFMDFRWPVVLFIAILYVALFFGLFSRKRNRDNNGLKVARYLFLSVFFGYVISWFFMEGDHSLVRRLDAILTFLLVVFSLLGLFILFKKIKSSNLQKISILLLVLLFSWATATTYASGPDMRVVSSFEYEVADYLWKNIDDAKNTCVIADTWPLLILESLSSQKIVGGGFPIDSQFGQEERVELYEGVQNMEIENLAQEAHDLSGKNKCFVVLPQNQVNLDMENYLKDEFNDEGKLVADFVVWKEMASSTFDGM